MGPSIGPKEEEEPGDGMEGVEGGIPGSPPGAFVDAGSARAMLVVRVTRRKIGKHVMLQTRSRLE